MPCQSGPSGVRHGDTRSGHCRLGAALSSMAFDFQQSLFLSTTSNVKHFPYILPTEPQKKKNTRVKNTTRKKERERPEEIVEPVPPPLSQWPSAASGPGTQPCTGLSEA